LKGGKIKKRKKEKDSYPGLFSHPPPQPKNEKERGKKRGCPFLPGPKKGRGRVFDKGSCNRRGRRGRGGRNNSGPLKNYLGDCEKKKRKRRGEWHLCQDPHNEYGGTKEEGGGEGILLRNRLTGIQDGRGGRGKREAHLTRSDDDRKNRPARKGVKKKGRRGGEKKKEDRGRDVIPRRSVKGEFGMKKREKGGASMPKLPYHLVLWKGGKGEKEKKKTDVFITNTP